MPAIDTLPPDDLAARKRAVRREVGRARGALDAEARQRAGRRLAAVGLSLARERAARLLACYASVGTEPPTGPLIATLRAAQLTVLLPVVRPDGLLDWAPADEAPLRAGPLGLLEPVGRRLGPGALADVELALLPALGVDRRGQRLGRGGGYVDRALRLARPALAVAVGYDSELVAALPAGPDDEPVDAALRPAGWIMLDRTGPR